MDGFTIDFPTRDLAALRSQMERAGKDLHKSGGQAVKFGAWAVASSLGASTKVSAKNRPVAEIPTSRKKTKKFEITSFKAGSKRVFPFYATGKRELLKSGIVRIGKKGLAKASWMWGIKKLGSSRGAGSGSTASAKKTGRKVIDVTQALRGDNPSVTIRNKLDYVMEALRAGPQDVETAMGRAARQMEKIINDRIAKTVFR